MNLREAVQAVMAKLQIANQRKEALMAELEPGPEDDLLPADLRGARDAWVAAEQELDDARKVYWAVQQQSRLPQG